nr:hypothetical protein Iba_chr14aCG25420 [Ipomoea batatas]
MERESTCHRIVGTRFWSKHKRELRIEAVTVAMGGLAAGGHLCLRGRLVLFPHPVRLLSSRPPLLSCCNREVVTGFETTADDMATIVSAAIQVTPSSAFLVLCSGNCKDFSCWLFSCMGGLSSSESKTTGASKSMSNMALVFTLSLATDGPNASSSSLRGELTMSVLDAAGLAYPEFTKGKQVFCHFQAYSDGICEPRMLDEDDGSIGIQCLLSSLLLASSIMSLWIL